MLLWLIFMMLWMAPGAVLARGMYSEAVREIQSKPVQVVPPKPPRPEYKLSEQLHSVQPKRCQALVGGGCNCRHRDDWLRMKNAWLDYDEWNHQYGHIKNGVLNEPKVKMLPIYTAVPAWPLMLIALYIKGGAKNIPDYRQIEQMEQELKELEG